MPRCRYRLTGQVGQRYRWIRQPRQVDGLPGEPGPYQRLDLVLYVPDVDVHAGEYAPLLDPERDELARLDVAPEHHRVVPARLDPARVLHAEVVLVGEEVRHPV